MMQNTQGMTVTLDAKAVEALTRCQQALSAFQAVGHGSDEGADLFIASEKAAEELGRQVADLAPATLSEAERNPPLFPGLQVVGILIMVVAVLVVVCGIIFLADGNWFHFFTALVCGAALCLLAVAVMFGAFSAGPATDDDQKIAGIKQGQPKTKEL